MRQRRIGVLLLSELTSLGHIQAKNYITHCQSTPKTFPLRALTLCSIRSFTPFFARVGTCFFVLLPTRSYKIGQSRFPNSDKKITAMGVSLRYRETRRGKVYWLDISESGHRSRRTLKIAWDLTEKQRRQFAEIAAAEQQKALMTDSIGAMPKKSRNFFAFFDNYIAGLPPTNRKYSNTVRHMRLCFGAVLYTNQMRPEIMETWRAYLMKHFNGETPLTMWKATRRVVNVAKRQGLLTQNVFVGIRPPPISDTISKPILSHEEIVKMSGDLGSHPEICKAFLWCCMTGMARADMVLLKWSDIDRSRRQLKYKRAKNGLVVVVDLTDTALSLLPEEKTNRVFPDLASDSYCSRIIRNWAKRSGVDKKISWYSARHSFAVLLLEGGADLLTVSKIMGHTTTHHTVRYLKLTDTLKRKAVDKLPKF